MSRSFSYKDAKELIRYFKDLMANFKKIQSFSNECQRNLKLVIRNLHNKDFFSRMVERVLKENKTIFDESELDKLLVNIYLYKESCKYAEKYNSLLNNCGETIKNNISTLSSGSNGIFWLFSSKNKKERVEKSYEELVKMKDDDSVMSMLSVFLSVKTLKNIDLVTIKQDYEKNKIEFGRYMKEISDVVILDHRNAPVFKKCEEENKLINSDLTI